MLERLTYYQLFFLTQNIKIHVCGRQRVRRVPGGSSSTFPTFSVGGGGNGSGEGAFPYPLMQLVGDHLAGVAVILRISSQVSSSGESHRPAHPFREGRHPRSRDRYPDSLRRTSISIPRSWPCAGCIRVSRALPSRDPILPVLQHRMSSDPPWLRTFSGIRAAASAGSLLTAKELEGRAPAYLAFQGSFFPRCSEDPIDCCPDEPCSLPESWWWKKARMHEPCFLFHDHPVSLTSSLI